MSGQHQQQTIYTIHESQLNNGGGGAGAGAGGGGGGNGSGHGNGGGAADGQRNASTDILIDTSSIPLTQQQMPPIQHQHQLQPQQAQQLQPFDHSTITSQPAGLASGARVAPENQNVVYSVHPVFSMLDNHDTLLVRQKADCTSTCCGFESVNTYTVRARDGSPLLKAIENSNCCERCCFEGNREYNLSLVHGDEVVARIRKAYRVSRFCCYSNSVRIESPEDNPIGHIRQLFSLFGHPRYAIYDCQQPPKRASFYLESVSCRLCCSLCLCTCVCGNREFRIISAEDQEEVGTISRHWSQAGEGGQAGQADADGQHADPEEPFGSAASQLFGVQFAPNLEARQKVLLLSACFMMDFFYFENDRRRRKLASC